MYNLVLQDHNKTPNMTIDDYAVILEKNRMTYIVAKAIF